MFSGLRNTTKYKKHIGIGLLLLSVCGIVVLNLYFGNTMFSNRNIFFSSRWKEAPDTYYVKMSHSLFDSETISLWFDENNARYMLFLPSFYQESDTLSFYDTAGDSFVLDGEILDGGKVSGLKEGMHTLAVSGSSGAELCSVATLEVVKSANVRTAFLSMKNDHKDKLFEEPYAPVANAFLQVLDANGEETDACALSEIRVRGNTSADWTKKPFQMTLSQNTNLCGLGSGVHWNLLSNWSDKTLLRNEVALHMAKEANLPYTPDDCFVDLYMNGEYMGCYQLCEKVEIAEDRLAITNLEDYTVFDSNLSKKKRNDDKLREMEPVVEDGVTLKGYDMQVGTDDISGGYLLEIERPSRIADSISYFVTKNGQPVTIKSPKIADWSEVRYIAGCWQTFEDALFSEDGMNPGTGKSYADYIDFDSFVRKYLVEEIVRNYDASSTSQYFYKEKGDDLLHAGPVWDYDMSLGNPIMSPLTNQNYISSVSPYGLFAALYMDDFSLWAKLCEQPDFQKRVRELYKQDFLPYLQSLEHGGIDEMANLLHDATIADGIRWKRNRGENASERDANLQEEMDVLKSFVSEREKYLTGFWLDGRESKRVYLDGGMADMYVSYVENLIGEAAEMPAEPSLEGYTFKEWLNGYTLTPYDFTKALDEEPLYLVASYTNNEDGSVLIAGQEEE